MIKIKTQHELQTTMKEHYEKGENIEIIIKTLTAIEFLLTIGMNTKKITEKIMDLGVKTTELGLSMALALKNTEDKYLSELDLEIKRITLEQHSEMIKEMEGLMN